MKNRTNINIEIGGPAFLLFLSVFFAVLRLLFGGFLLRLLFRLLFGGLFLFGFLFFGFHGRLLFFLLLFGFLLRFLFLFLRGFFLQQVAQGIFFGILHRQAHFHRAGAKQPEQAFASFLHNLNIHVAD